MRLLLDTHALVWWIRASPLLSGPAREAIAQESSTVSVSVASAWEIAIKVGQGRWPEARELLESFEYAIAEEGFHILPISVSHVRTAGLLQSPHRDPFDRKLDAGVVESGKVPEFNKQSALRDLAALESAAAGLTVTGKTEAAIKAVHYNAWANFGKKDFQPVVNAFKDLLSQFRCDACQSWLYVSPKGASLLLRCGKFKSERQT